MNVQQFENAENRIEIDLNAVIGLYDFEQQGNDANESSTSEENEESDDESDESEESEESVQSGTETAETEEHEDENVEQNVSSTSTQPKCTDCHDMFAKTGFEYYYSNGTNSANASDEDDLMSLNLEGMSMDKVPTLKEAASLKIAMRLWNHINIEKIVKQKDKRCKDMGCLLHHQVRKLIKRLPKIPRTLAKQISTNVSIIKGNLNNWVWYNLRKMYYFKHKSNDITAIYHDMYLHWYRIIWYPDGSIDYKRTAINLLQSHRLSTVEKYYMLATYCLKEQIDQNIPASLFAGRDLDRIRFFDNPIIFYWNSYYTGKMYEIPSSTLDQESLDSYMFSEDKVDNWLAKEYFFDRMNSQEQTKCTCMLIRLYYGRFQKALWKKLDHTQRLEVLSKNMFDYVRNYAMIVDGEEDIIATWHDIRSTISADDFAQILSILVYNNVDTDILRDIWNWVPNSYKDYAWYYNDYEIFKDAMRNYQDMEDEFFLTLISYASINQKQQLVKQPFFVNDCAHQFDYYDIDTLRRILNACLATPQDSLEFRKILVGGDRFKNRCYKLILHHELSFLNRLLACLLPEVELVEKFKSHVVKQNFFREICLAHVNNWHFDKLHRLLKVFLPGPEKVFEFKNAILTKSQTIETFCLNSYAAGSTQPIDHMLNQVLYLPPSSKLLSKYVAEYKKNLILSPQGMERCKNLYKSGIDVTKIIDESLIGADRTILFRKMRYNVLLRMRRTVD